jgi:hypothetical protein
VLVLLVGAVQVAVQRLDRAVGAGDVGEVIGVNHAARLTAVFRRLGG